MRSGKTVPAVIICLSLLFASVISSAAAGSGETYENPVLAEIFESPVVGTVGIGDPDVLFFEGRFYLYPTGDNHGYDVYVSSDLVHWIKGPRVFETRESGAWAPDVLRNPADGKFYLYYTVNRQIGVAVADRPDGNFRDLGLLIEGAIDADMFLDDDGKYYLYYASYPGFRIYVQPMEDAVKKEGPPVLLIGPDRPWEKRGQPVTEAPWMLKHKGGYYLLYSGGGPDTEHYAIGYAFAKSPAGPFRKYAGNPIVRSGPRVYGPGHCSVIATPGGRLWMIYHQKRSAAKDWDRVICIDPLWFDAKGILHGKATRGTPEPAPRVK